MKKNLITIWGGVSLTLLMVSGISLAQDYRGKYYQNDASGVIYDYRSQPAYNYPGTRGSYYSRHYRPRMMPPPVKVKSPVDLLEESINKVIDFLARPQQASLEQITLFIKKEITPHFDFNYMSRWVAGRYYRTMTVEQQRQFNATFSELFITTFVQKLSNYQTYPPVVDNFKSRRTSEDEALASAQVIQENGTSIQVDFKFIKTGSGWKVVDVRANGVSALFYYRNYFAEQIRKQQQNQAVFQ